jgi:glucose-6-phosphate isomerase
MTTSQGRSFPPDPVGREWCLDDSRLELTEQQRAALGALAEANRLESAVEELFAGAKVNTSEDRPALHMALRASDPQVFHFAGADAYSIADRDRFLALAEQLHKGRSGLETLLHVGIGGSDLGPRLLHDALGDSAATLDVHFLSTLDHRLLRRLLQRLDPATTGLVVASKSFSTEETLLQATAIRDWMGEHFRAQAWAATARPEKAMAFGIPQNAIFPFPEWTGGRFSLWSSVGLSAAASIGRDRFEALLQGAEQADLDFRQCCANPKTAILSLHLARTLHHWRRIQGYSTLGLIAYEPRLARLGDYLQQLIMESLGKRVDTAGQNLSEPTAPLVFTGVGTDGQHALFQAFHQGMDDHPLILVGTLEDEDVDPDWHRTQLAHLLGQAEAFSSGVEAERSCQQLPGHRPVALLMARRLTAFGLGYLLASFEHAVYALSVFWRVNAFDQWGVEEGKRLARSFKKNLASRPFDLADLPRAGDFLKDSDWVDGLVDRPGSKADRIPESKSGSRIDPKGSR